MVECDGFVEVEVGVFFKITALSSSDSWSQIFCPSGDTLVHWSRCIRTWLAALAKSVTGSLSME